MHVLTFQVRNQDTLFVFSGISIEGREIGWAWLKVIECMLSTAVLTTIFLEQRLVCYDWFYSYARWLCESNCLPTHFSWKS